MESFPLFFTIRTVAFAIIMMFSFLWTVLLTVEMFARWTVSDRISHSLIILLILTNTITLIVLPILILVKFRVWLDAARLLLLFVLQAGSAAAGTYWSPRIQCPDQTPDETGVCQLINVYTLIACWITPAILLFYSTYFAIVVYLQSCIPVVVEPARRLDTDPETGLTHTLSVWRDMVKDIVGVPGSGTNTSVQPRPLVLPSTIQTGQSSLPQSLATQPQSTLPNALRRQPTMPSSVHTNGQDLAPYSAPSRHRSLPVFRHGHEPHISPLPTFPVQQSLATNAPTSHPQTPSSNSYSTPSSANSQTLFINFGPDVVNTQSPRDHRWRSTHLSMMLSSSSPGEMRSGRGGLTTYPTRPKLARPLPTHLM